jgi:hypothetical protein
VTLFRVSFLGLLWRLCGRIAEKQFPQFRLLLVIHALDIAQQQLVQIIHCF